MSIEPPDDMFEDYTMEDLHRDMEGLRKAGLIEVIGITDDGQWLYGATEKSKKYFELEKTMDPDEYHAMMEEVLSSIHDDDNLSE